MISRFRSPGSRSLGNAGLSKPMAPAAPGYHLEGPVPAPDAASSAGAHDQTPAAGEVIPVVEPSPVPAARPAHAAEPEPESQPEVAAALAAEAPADTIDEPADDGHRSGGRRCRGGPSGRHSRPRR